MNWAPGGWPAKLMKVWWIQMLCKSCTMLSRAQLIVARVSALGFCSRSLTAR